MLYREIEKSFSTDTGLEKLIDECQKEYFTRIDTIAQSFRNGVLENTSALMSALDELTGIYLALQPIVAVAVSEKENRELRRYEEIRIAFENNPPLDAKGNPKSFTSAPTEKEASASVAGFRKVRNIMEAYLNACEKGISTCQSKLKFMAKEVDLAGK